MVIHIGDKIRAYREKKGVSQDDFAKYLGATCKEVIKWESGDTYPPFEMIPVIAKYFDTTTDELMCMEEFDNEDRIKEYTDIFQENVSIGKIKEAVEAIREGLLHFPQEYRLKCLLMYGLYLSCDRPASVKFHSEEILSLGDDILTHSTDDFIRLEAKRLLCLHYYEDLRDTDTARRIAMSLPGRKSCREDMLPIVSEGKPKLTAIQANISAYASLLIDTIIDYCENEHSLTVKDKISFCETARRLRETIYTDGDMFEDAYNQMTLLKHLAVLYMTDEQPEKALDALASCARCAADFDRLQKTSFHTSPLVRDMKFSKQQLRIPNKNKKTPLKDIFMNEIMPLQCFDPIKYNPRIAEICAVFRSND